MLELNLKKLDESLRPFLRAAEAWEALQSGIVFGLHEVRYPDKLSEWCCEFPEGVCFASNPVDAVLNAKAEALLAKKEA